MGATRKSSNQPHARALPFALRAARQSPFLPLFSKPSFFVPLVRFVVRLLRSRTVSLFPGMLPFPSQVPDLTFFNAFYRQAASAFCPSRSPFPEDSVFVPFGRFVVPPLRSRSVSFFPGMLPFPSHHDSRSERLSRGNQLVA